MSGEAYPNWDLLHPLGRGRFMSLSDDLTKGYKLGIGRTLFRPFELWRSPEDQRKAYMAAKSKARAWQSPHQYGLAVDFVPFVNGRWSWAEGHDYAFLKNCAAARGLVCQGPGLEWDLCHVQHPVWPKVLDLLRADVSGVQP